MPSLLEPLPEIAIPFLTGDPPLPLDLEGVFQHTYDAGPYRRAIDYRQDTLAPPRDRVWQEWLRHVVACFTFHS